MFNLFKKRDQNAQNSSSDSGQSNEDLTAPTQQQQQAVKPGDEGLAAEVMKMKAEVEAFSDVRKATNEKLTRLSEQIGELRAMIADRDKVINQIEVKAIKAADLVATVKPEEQMLEIKKQDAKLEAFRAGLESNELLMKRVLEELKEMRTRINSFRGVEETIKLNNEVKAEIIEIKKVEANIQKHADKVETIFAEVQKRFVDFTKIDDRISNNSKQITELSKNLEAVKATANSAATKKSVDELTSKLLEMKNQLSELVATINRRLSMVEKNKAAAFEAFERAISYKFKLSNEEVSAFKQAVQADRQNESKNGEQLQSGQNPEQNANQSEVPVEMQAVSDKSQQQQGKTPQPSQPVPDSLPQPSNAQQAQSEQEVKPPQNNPSTTTNTSPAANASAAAGTSPTKTKKSPKDEIREAARFAKRIKSRKSKRK